MTRTMTALAAFLTLVPALTLAPVLAFASAGPPPAPKPKPEPAAAASVVRTSATMPVPARPAPAVRAEPAAVTTAPAAPAQRRESAAAQTGWQSAIQLALLSQAGEARRIADGMGNPTARKLVDYLYFTRKDSGASFAEIVSFIDQNPTWPSRDLLMRRAEEALKLDGTPTGIIAWFEKREPVSAEGRLRLAEALLSAGREREGIRMLKAAWAAGGLDPQVEASTLDRYGQYLTSADHLARATRFLSENERPAAARLLPRLDQSGQRLIQARIALGERASNADQLAAALPVSLQTDPGLALDRSRYRRKKDQDDEALAALDSARPDATLADRYWNERQYHARRLLGSGRIADAYRAASEHHLPVPSVANEAEWLAGWIALRFMDAAETASEHFRRVVETVKLPVSVSRGAYWSGRAQEAMGNTAGARIWYEAAAQHGATYYGQMAQARLDPNRPLTLIAEPRPTAADFAAFETKELAQAVRLLGDGGQPARDFVRVFVLRMADLAVTPVEHELIADLADRIGRVDLGVVSAKRSARNGSILVERLYPIVDMTRHASLPEPALVMATARQESEFNASAISPAGARGLMQLMPGTAKEVAKELGLPYQQADLTQDATYNTTLGTRYLQRMIENFDGSYVLALCAYNAGASRAWKWTRDWGDPRRADVDAVDWIELIPFDETRNYVQRILEGTMVYRQRLEPGRPVLTRLQRDVRGGAGARDG